MWNIHEHQQLTKIICKLPVEIIKRYEKWKDIVRLSGPAGLKLIKGFHDEQLQGVWQGYRSSRLNLQYRVIYQISAQYILVRVLNISAHDYRRKR